MAHEGTRLNAEELLAELGWLRGLARSLVGSVNADEDLVQEAWLAASRVKGGVSRAWLVGTLRNLSAGWHRREARLRRREDAAARPEAVDTDSLLERNELFGVVLGELRNLDPPYSTVLLLIYQEGLSIQAAATKLGIPVDTLRWQHREALAQLRLKLDRKGDDWRAAFLPLLSIPSIKLAEATVASSAVVKTATHVGGFMMTWKTLTAALVAVLALLYTLTNHAGEAALQPEAVMAGIPGAPEIGIGLAEPEPEPEPELALRKEAPAPIEVEELWSPPPTEGKILKVLVEDEQRRPVQGARVWLGAAPEPVDEVWATDEDGIALLPMPAERAQPDANLRSVHFGHSFRVQSSTATHYGNASADTRDSGGEAYVRIYPDADLTVRVVDGAGNPVEGVPVGKIDSRPKRKRFDPATSTTTNAEGIAVMRHVLDDFKFDQDLDSFNVGPAILLRERADVTIPRAQVPRDPVLLVLPPTGSIALKVLDGEGALNRTVARVRLVSDPARGTDRSTAELSEAAKLSPLGMMDIDVADGIATVPFIGLGLDFLAEAPDADPMESTFGFAAALDRQGASAALVLRPLEAPPSIVGIARAEDGSVHAQRSMQARIAIFRGRTMEQSIQTITTDSEGRFLIPVAKPLVQKWAKLDDRRLELSFKGAGRFDKHASETSPPEQLQNGENDVGSTLFVHKTPWLSGRAVDTLGAEVPLRGARIVIRTPQGPKSFRALREVDVFFDGSAFAFLGTPPGADAVDGGFMEVWCYAEGQPDTAMDVFIGQQDAVVTFRPGGSLEGQLKTADGDSPQGYYLTFRTGEASEERNRPKRIYFARNGRFREDRLPAVPGDLEIRTLQREKLVMSIPGFLPGSDSEQQARRLNPIVLNTALNEIVLRVVDEDGNAIKAASFGSVAPSFEVDSYASGMLVWQQTEASLVGVVGAPGFRTVPVELRLGAQTVTLPRGPRIVVRPDQSTELSRGARLVVQLEAADTREEVELVPLEGIGFVGYVSGEGAYLVRGLIHHDGSPIAELPFSGDPLARVLVTDRDATQEFTVAFDLEAFEARIPGD